ncbi:MAG: hypothetical protein KDF60_17250 [Calditrichaeota bacterium]|nr:hypothetical protein [Calditrichota bacterium]
MEKIYKILLISIFFCFLTVSLYAQNADSAQVQQRNQQDQNQIIEAGESLIQIQVEKPQVQLFSQRIKPEFDEVNLEKSFVKEILDEGQTLKITSNDKSEKRRIDLKTIVNKNR